MARRKKGNRINGWLVLDKPVGLSSTQALSRVRRLFNAQKAGHAGTLDPLASGVLPIAFGEATKTVPHAVDGTKRYRFTVRWGEETTTDDTEGGIVHTAAQRPEDEDITAALGAFTGEISQVPPQFSAIKVDGNRAYDLARDGEVMELEPRTVVIDALRLLERPDRDTATFVADCGKGTYVRAIARDLGRKLGCYGHVCALRRERVANFFVDDALTISDLEDIAETGGEAELLHTLHPVEEALADLPGITVSASDAASLARGQAVLLRGRDAPILEGAVYVMSKGRLVALADLRQGSLHPARVFNLG